MALRSAYTGRQRTHDAPFFALTTAPGCRTIERRYGCVDHSGLPVTGRLPCSSGHPRCPPRRNRSSYASEAMLRATTSITLELGPTTSWAELQSPSSDEAKEASLGEHPLSSGRHHLLKGGISGGSRRDTGAEVVAVP